MAEQDPPTDADRLGRAIQLRRVALGLKRPALAERALLSYPYISEIENGVKTPSTKALRQLASALEMSPAELIELADKLDTSESPPGSGRWEGSVDRFVPGPSSSPQDPEVVGSAIRQMKLQASKLPIGPASYQQTESSEFLDRQTQILIAAIVRAEVAAWARVELPQLIREAIEQAIRTKDK